jgi:hypothetical protein
VEFDAGASRWDCAWFNVLGRSRDRAAACTLEARLKVLQQRGDFGRLEHGGFDEQRRARRRHKSRVVLDQTLDRFAIVGVFAARCRHPAAGRGLGCRSA